MKVFLDMDGVLVDFVKGACDAHGRSDPYIHFHGHAAGEYDLPKILDVPIDGFWEPMKPVEFWRDLPWTPDGIAILAATESAFFNDTIYLLTHAQPWPGSYSGKAQWVAEHAPEYNGRLIFTEHKRLLAAPDTLLIDDCDRQVDEFQAAGGRAILVPRGWNREHQRSRRTLEAVTKAMKEFTWEDKTTKDTNPKDAIGCKKVPMSCVPLPVLMEMGLAMLEGSCKYGRHNYRAIGVRASVYFDAACRHLFSYWEGEETDPDSGLPHIVKAMACLAVMRDSQMQGNFTDDRPPVSQAAWVAELNRKAEAMLDRFPDPKQPHTKPEGRAEP